jgi:hypothetical protein
MPRSANQRRSRRRCETEPVAYFQLTTALPSRRSRGLRPINVSGAMPTLAWACPLRQTSLLHKKWQGCADRGYLKFAPLGSRSNRGQIDCLINSIERLFRAMGRNGRHAHASVGDGTPKQCHPPVPNKAKTLFCAPERTSIHPHDDRCDRYQLGLHSAGNRA